MPQAQECWETLAQGNAALWLQVMGPNVSMAAIHCWRSS